MQPYNQFVLFQESKNNTFFIDSPLGHWFLILVSTVANDNTPCLLDLVLIRRRVGMASLIAANEIVNLTCPTSSISSTAKASSTWNHDTRRFGPQNALDNTCDFSWNSGPLAGDDGISSNNAQYYEIHFHRLVRVNEIRVQFQGGFVGLDCVVYYKKSNKQPSLLFRSSTDDDGKDSSNNRGKNDNDDNNLKWEEMEELYMDPVDTTHVQSFYSDIEVDNVAAASPSTNPPVTAIRIEFGKSTDFYGRIVLYSIEVWGIETSE